MINYESHQSYLLWPRNETLAITLVSCKIDHSVLREYVHKCLCSFSIITNHKDMAHINTSLYIIRALLT